MPCEAQQIQLSLLGLHPAQVVDGVEVRQARVVVQVLLRDRQLRQQQLGGAVQRLQPRTLVPLACHLPPAEIPGVLLQDGQLGQGVVAHQQFGEGRRCCIVQRRGEQPAQAAALGRQRLADQPLQGRVAGPLDLVLVEVDDKFRDDEARRDVAAHDLRSLLFELREKLAGPEPVVEQPGDQGALRIVLVLGDGARLEGLAGKVAAEHEGVIVLGLVPGEAKEGLLGLEVADLQRAPRLGLQPGAAAGESQLRLGQAQVVQPLTVVEIGQSVQGVLFGRRQHGQQLALRCWHCSGARARVLLSSEGRRLRGRRGFRVRRCVGK